MNDTVGDRCVEAVDGSLTTSSTSSSTSIRSLSSSPSATASSSITPCCPCSSSFSAQLSVLDACDAVGERMSNAAETVHTAGVTCSDRPLALADIDCLSSFSLLDCPSLVRRLHTSSACVAPGRTSATFFEGCSRCCTTALSTADTLSSIVAVAALCLVCCSLKALICRAVCSCRPLSADWMDRCCCVIRCSSSSILCCTSRCIVSAHWLMAACCCASACPRTTLFCCMAAAISSHTRDSSQAPLKCGW